MRVLVAEDDMMMCQLLTSALYDHGYDVVTVTNGRAALELMQSETAPEIAILDWMMPGLDGPEVCRQLRESRSGANYLILLTSRESKEDVIVGLQSGANDYITKPFDYGELQARVGVGRSVVQLQTALENRIRELETALGQVKILRGLLPICSYCKRVRDSKDYWEQVELYISRHTDAQFSHGICPDCWRTEVEPQLAEIERIKRALEE